MHSSNTVPARERHLRALVADDNEINRRIMSAILEPTGASVTLAKDGLEALYCFLDGRFDLIFMDVEMPMMNGLDAVRSIRAHEAKKGLVRTPLFVVSAHCTPQDVSASLDAGADAHFAKPLNVQSLKAAIADVFAARPLSQPMTSDTRLRQG